MPCTANMMCLNLEVKHETVNDIDNSLGGGHFSMLGAEVPTV